VRSPVEAGSSEYSAVIQPVPRPDIQRGTPSSIVAVQSTTVFPCAQSTLPCGCSRKSGWSSSGRSSSGRRPSARVIRTPQGLATSCCKASCGGSLEVCDRDRLDLVDRKLEEARAHVAERLGVAGGEEAVRALAVLGVLDP